MGGQFHLILTSHIKTFHEMYISVGVANREKLPKQERDDIRFTHIAIPTSFYPSPPRGPTQYPHANYLSIHHPRNPPIAPHKHNNSKFTLLLMSLISLSDN